MRRCFFIFILVGCLFSDAGAQDQPFEYADSSLLQSNEESDENSVTVNEDITGDTVMYIHPIVMPPDTIVSWKRDKDFAYLKNLDSLLKVKQQQDASSAPDVRKKYKPSFWQRIFSSGVTRVILWMIAIAFIIFILYRLFLSNGVFVRKSNAVLIKESPEAETVLSQADYDALIKQSVNAGDYRLAVRYYFLSTINKLSDKGFLRKAADKTNYQYVNELAPDKRTGFSRLVLNYEYTWYGKVDIDKLQFAQIEQSFIEFNSKI